MKSTFLLITSLALLASAPAHAGDNSFLGTGIGAALGGYLGSHIGKGDGQLAATAGGVFLGGLIGNSIGSSMDNANTSYAGGSYYAPMTSYDTGYSTYVPNYVAPQPPSQVVFVQPPQQSYYVPTYEQPVYYAPTYAQPTSVYVEGSYVGAPPPPRHGPRHHRDRHCREFTQTVRIDGQVRESYGTACLRPDGTWQMERD